MIISHLVLVKMRNVSDNICRENPNTHRNISDNVYRENQNKHCMYNTYSFSEIHIFYDIKWRRIVEADRPQMTI